MANVEVDNFVRKFQLLLSAGHEAALDVKCNMGEVTINLQCKIGRNVPPPTHYSGENQNNGIFVKRESPSRQRRRIRRAAERDASNESTNVSNDSAEESVHVDINVEHTSETHWYTTSLISW